MELHFVTALPTGTTRELIEKAARIKKSGMKCVDVFKREVVETATGKHVMDMYELVFKGNPIQYIRARHIIATNVDPDSVLMNINPND